MAAASGGDNAGASAPRTKVVIRRLPPTLPEETFWRSVENWVTENTCLWKRYVKGKAAEGYVVVLASHFGLLDKFLTDW